MELIRHGLELVAIVAFLATCYAISYVFQYFARRYIEEEGEDGPPLARKSGKKKPMKEKVIRGQPLVTLAEAKMDLEKNAPPPDVMPRTFFQSGLWLPRKEETNNLIVLGSVDSGKTLTAKILQGTLLRRIISPIDDEFVGGVVYDYKRELKGTLCGIVGPDRVLNLNPFAEGSIAPDFPSMFDSEARSYALAESLVPRGDKEAQPFWTLASQDLIAAVTLVFNERSEGRWDLRDLLEAIASIERLTFVLKQSRRTQHLVDTYLSTEITSKNVLASIRASTRAFRPVAAIWARTPTKINLKDFVEQLGKVLIFQPDHEKRTAAKVVQRLILTRLFEYTLDLDDSTRRRMFWFLDEIQELGHLELLPTVLATGRSKGASILIFTQTIDGLLKEYGEQELGKMLDNVSTRTFFRANGKTAEFVAKLFGSIEVERYLNTKVDTEPKKDGDAEKGSTKSRSQHFHSMEVLQPPEVSAIPPPSPEHGLTSININRLTRPFHATLKGLDQLVPKPMPGIPAFKARPKEHEDLEPWTIEDLRRLKLTIGSDDDLAAILGAPPEEPPLPPTALPELVSEPKVDDGISGKLIGRIKGFMRGAGGEP